MLGALKASRPSCLRASPGSPRLTIGEGFSSSCEAPNAVDAGGIGEDRQRSQRRKEPPSRPEGLSRRALSGRRKTIPAAASAALHAAIQVMNFHHRKRDYHSLRATLMHTMRHPSGLNLPDGGSTAPLLPKVALFFRAAIRPPSKQENRNGRKQ